MINLPNNYRFRTNWRGKLILQRMVEVTVWDDSPYTYDHSKRVIQVWKDVRLEDAKEISFPVTIA